MIKNLVEGKKYIMTEADGITKKEVIYKGIQWSSIARPHKLYVIDDDIEFKVPDTILQLMNLESIEDNMKKKLVIVTTDMKIELAILVDATKLTNTREAIAEAREIYYYGGEFRSRLFDDVLAETMKEYGIDFEIIEHEEM